MSNPAAGNTMDGPTARIAQRVCEVGYGDLDAATVDAVKRLVLDGIAVAVAGAAEEAPRLVAQYVKDQGSRAEASVWTFGFRTTAVQSAYANAASMHVLDFEPMSSPPTHAVSPTVPVAFTLGEARSASGAEIVAACAKGFEMQGRVLLASSHQRGSLPFHTPGVVGVMGSTAAASHLLQLAPTQLSHAFGMAASRCGGLSANTGSMVKCTHCGNAAAAGLEAALMASRGYTAHPGIFEARRGYVETFFPEHFDYEAMLRYGRPFRCVDPGMAIKFFPSKYPTHFVIAAALALRKKVPDLSRIAKLSIVTPDIDDADRPAPRSGLEGKFSFQYVAATALVDGHVGMGSFTDELRFRPAIVDLLAKTSLERDRTRAVDTRRMSVDVEAVLHGGTRVRETCSKPPGFWGEPVDRGLHESKVRDCLSVRLSPDRVERVLALAYDLERLSAPQVQELIALLG